MSGEFADPGHVWVVRRWLQHNSERIAAVTEPPGAGHKCYGGADFVRWLEELLTQHHSVCQQHFDRDGRPHQRYAGD